MEAVKIMRHKLSGRNRLRGIQALVHSDGESAPALKEWARRFLSKHNARAAMIVLLLLMLTAHSWGQRSNVSQPAPSTTAVAANQTAANADDRGPQSPKVATAGQPISPFSVARPIFDITSRGAIAD